MATTQYGIGVTKNRFELFDDDEEDPLEVLKMRELEKEARKKTKLSEKENKGKEVQAKSKVAPQRKGIKETQNLKPTEAHKAGKEDKARVTFRTERPERKFNPENNREERNNHRNRPDRPAEKNGERPERFERREFRGGERPVVGAGPQSSEGGPSGGGGGGSDVRGGRGRGGGQRGGNFNSRGGRGGRGGQRPPYDGRGKREYDRQSGSDKTGVKPIDKREGSGAHNWGNHKDDLEDIQDGNQTQNAEDSTWWNPEKTDETVTENGGNAPEGEENVSTQVEEEPRELTLDEWKALKAPRQKPTYNLRKAGEGEDLSQWKKMYALQKKKEEEEEEEDEYEYEEYPQRVGRQKHVLDIDIHFKDTRGGGRGRGGRGTGRGGPRMGTRATQNQAFVEKHVFNNPREPKTAPKVDDEHDFPSLG